MHSLYNTSSPSIGHTCKVVHGLGHIGFGLKQHLTQPDRVEHISTHRQPKRLIKLGRSNLQQVVVNLFGVVDLENGEN